MFTGPHRVVANNPNSQVFAVGRIERYHPDDGTRIIQSKFKKRSWCQPIGVVTIMDPRRALSMSLRIRLGRIVSNSFSCFPPPLDSVSRSSFSDGSQAASLVLADQGGLATSRKYQLVHAPASSAEASLVLATLELNSATKHMNMKILDTPSGMQLLQMAAQHQFKIQGSELRINLQHGSLVIMPPQTNISFILAMCLSLTTIIRKL